MCIRDREDGALHAVLEADHDYQGRWIFDHPRHRRWLRHPDNLPRLNEDPEWFAVEGDEWYAITVDGQPTRIVLGAALHAGLPVSVTGDAPRHIRVEAFGPTPANGFRLRVEGPRAVPAGAEAVTVALSHDLPFAVRPRSDPPVATVPEIGPGERVEVELQLAPLRRWVGGIETFRVRFFDPHTMSVGSWTGCGAPAADVVDVRLLRGDGVTEGVPWCAVGAEGLQIDLELPEGAAAAALELRWFAPGAPEEVQEALFRFEGSGAEAVASTAPAGSWTAAPVPAGAAVDGRVRVRLAPRAEGGVLRVGGVALCRVAAEDRGE